MSDFDLSIPLDLTDSTNRSSGPPGYEAAPENISSTARGRVCLLAVRVELQLLQLVVAAVFATLACFLARVFAVVTCIIALFITLVTCVLAFIHGLSAKGLARRVVGVARLAPSLARLKTSSSSARTGGIYAGGRARARLA